MPDNNLYVKFWGVRGSYPVPGNSTVRYGGNTSCVEIRANKHIIILDAGTGIVNLGQKLADEFQNKNQSYAVHLLFSHTHHDHIQGLPYFLPAYMDNCILNIYGPKSFSHDLRDVLSINMLPHYSPIELDELDAKINIQSFNENDVLILTDNCLTPDLKKRNEIPNQANEHIYIKLMRNYAHPKIGTFVIKIEVRNKSVVYATDAEGYIGGDTRLAQFALNTNLLIHDAQYDVQQYLGTQGYGHSTYEMAVQVAKTAKAQNLALFHHDPNHDDSKLSEMETRAQALFKNTKMAAEGIEYRF